MKMREAQGANPMQSIKRLVARSGEPVIRQAVRQAVKLLGDQFVLGTTIQGALLRARALEAKGFRFSFDMLGEAARTERDAERYYQRYMEAIDAVGSAAGGFTETNLDAIFARPSISVKLSALHPRFEPGKEARLVRELDPRLLTLARAARAKGIALTIDAEEQDRLDVTLKAFGEMFLDPHLDNWHGLGIAVQAYGKRAIPVLRWLRRLSQQSGRRIPVRLVKGAYWDSEIKWAQERGLADYPVFSRKLHTDVSYLACMRYLLADAQAFYPQFATHNAHAIASARVAGGSSEYEFQRLHGMGEALYEAALADDRTSRSVRIYAPVGGHEDLLGYLVRRLLENGANTSFVNRLADDETSVSDIVADPVEQAEREREEGKARAPLARPRDIFLPERKGSAGLALTENSVRAPLLADIGKVLKTPFAAGPIVNGIATTGGDAALLMLSPHDKRERVGTVRLATPANLEEALAASDRAAHRWDMTQAAERARVLEFAADLFERERAVLIAALVREAGKTIEAAQGEIREACDYLRYYAKEARRLFAEPVRLKSPTGEENLLSLRARGVFACISPWNFPVAIFTGQVAAALAAGNTVVAKPAEQTPVTAFLAVRLLHEAGIPKDVLHLVTGAGKLGEALIKDPRISGVAFTGSNETAWAIQRTLVGRRWPHHPVDCRDRRAQRHDRRQFGPARAGRARCGALGVRQRGTEVLGRARDVRAGRRGPAHQGNAGGRHRNARRGRPARLRDRYRPRNRRSGSRRSGRPQGPHGARRPRDHRSTGARELPGRHLCHACALRDRASGRAGEGSVRARAASGALRAGRHRQGGRGAQCHRLWPHARSAFAHRDRSPTTWPSMRASAISTSTATRSAPWWACSPSAARVCRVPARKLAVRIIWRALPPSGCARRTSPPRGATTRCFPARIEGLGPRNASTFGPVAARHGPYAWPPAG